MTRGNEVKLRVGLRRGRIQLLRLVVLVLLTSLSGLVAPANADTRVLCDGSPVPSGYVIIEHLATTACSGSTIGGARNAFKIATPYNGIVVCNGSPVPSGYVIPEHLTTTACSGSTAGGARDAFKIARPYNGIVVCDESPVPPGYAIIQYLATTACSGSTIGGAT